MIFEKLFKELVLDFNPELKFENSNNVSNVLLLKDFFIKSFNCKLRNGADGRDLFNRKDFEFYFDLYKENIENLISFKDFYTMLSTKVDDFDLRNKAYLFIYLFIYWELLDEKTKLKLQTTENPFNSAFKIVQRRGLVMVYNGEYQVGDIVVWPKEIKLPSIEDDFLDYIDSRCKVHGTSNIPNQEKVNELWNAFNEKKSKDE